MRLATWNVNSIRTRVDRVLAFLEREDIDALAMQEIKCRPDQFPVEPFEAAGYELAIHGLNQWNGVAIASRVGLDDIDTSFPSQPGWAAKPGDEPVVEARALGATVGAARRKRTACSQVNPRPCWRFAKENRALVSGPALRNGTADRRVGAGSKGPRPAGTVAQTLSVSDPCMSAGVS